MPKFVLLLIPVLCLLLNVNCGLAQQAATPVVSGIDRSRSFRNVRYCEVLPTYRDGATLRTEVWNTLGLNDCPEQAWQALDAATLQTELGAVRVSLNGPRYWVLDDIVALGGVTSAGKRATFGGIEMEQRATLETAVSAPRAGSTLYAPNVVQRNTRYVFDGGERIYTLSDPDGKTYVMQSYSLMIDPELTIEDLELLAERLTLPDGWTYQVVQLDQDLTLEVDGEATVIQDDLLNTYQLATVPVPGVQP